MKEKDKERWVVDKWLKIETAQDLTNLVNEVGPSVYGATFLPFSVKQITYFANPAICKKRYTSFSIKKKSGKERKIHAPIPGLKYLLGCLNYIFQAVYPIHHRAFGFVPGKSIRDNAALHVGKPFVYNIDISDFFHSFDLQKVKMALIYELNGLGKEREQLAFKLAALCTHPLKIEGEEKVVLPQGAPTSPTLTNIICLRLDRRLHGLAKRFKLTYSRYADDITFSGGEMTYENEAFQKELSKLLGQEGLKRNDSKTRSQGYVYRQEVTGLTVNEKVNVSRRFSESLRMYLYLWKRYGLKKATTHFESDYKSQAPNKAAPPHMINVLEGRLHFLSMVKGKDDNSYIGMRNKFEKLRKRDSGVVEDKATLESVVDTILMVGLQEGLDLLDELDLK